MCFLCSLLLFLLLELMLMGPRQHTNPNQITSQLSADSHAHICSLITLRQSSPLYCIDSPEEHVGSKSPLLLSRPCGVLNVNVQGEPYLCQANRINELFNKYDCIWHIDKYPKYAAMCSSKLSTQSWAVNALLWFESCYLVCTPGVARPATPPPPSQKQDC